VHHYRNHHEQLHIERDHQTGESISKSIAASAGYNFLSKDILGMDNLVFKAQSSNNDVEYAAIVAPDGKVVVHSDLAMRGQTLRDDEGRWISVG
jgi:hypothetical protein